MRRCILIVLDSVGVGEMADADKYNDKGSNTFKHVYEYNNGLKIDGLRKLGIANIDGNEYLGIRYKIAECGVPNLFVNLNGQKLTRQGIWRIVKEYSHKAGIKKDVNLNTLRHSFAVHMLQNGANVRAVQKMLGNQVLTYMDTYYEIINSDKINLIYRKTHPRA